MLSPLNEAVDGYIESVADIRALSRGEPDAMVTKRAQQTSMGAAIEHARNKAQELLDFLPTEAEDLRINCRAVGYGKWAELLRTTMMNELPNMLHTKYFQKCITCPNLFFKTSPQKTHCDACGSGAARKKRSISKPAR